MWRVTQILLLNDLAIYENYILNISSYYAYIDPNSLFWKSKNVTVSSKNPEQIFYGYTWGEGGGLGPSYVTFIIIENIEYFYHFIAFLARTSVIHQLSWQNAERNVYCTVNCISIQPGESNYVNFYGLI